MQTTTANQLRMRPVYDWVSEHSPEEFIARLSQLVSFDPAVDITFRSKHAVLSIPIEARHTWSPILKKNIALATLDAEYAEEGTEVQIEWMVEYERRQVKATVNKPMFYDPPRKKG